QIAQGAFVNPFVPVAGVDAEGEQGGANVGARLQGGGRVGAVVAEHVLLVRNAVIAGQLGQLARQVPVEGTSLICHGDGDAELRGILARRRRAVVDRDHGGYVRNQDRRGAQADFFG